MSGPLYSCYMYRFFGGRFDFGEGREDSEERDTSVKSVARNETLFESFDEDSDQEMLAQI